jgi:tight adherence protein C
VRPASALIVGGIAGLALRRRVARWQPWAGVVALTVVNPSAGVVAAAVVGAVVWWQRRAADNRIRREQRSDPDRLARGMLVGLSAGLPTAAALRRSAAEVGGEVGATVEQVLRRARRDGLAAALGDVDGELRPLATALARAQLTGAALIPAVTAHVDERRAMARARAIHEARTLSVRLVVPLALLILPGFVLIAAGPAVIGAINGLLGPVLPAP